MRTLDLSRIPIGVFAVAVLLSACTDAARDPILPEAPSAESRSASTWSSTTTSDRLIPQ